MCYLQLVSRQESPLPSGRPLPHRPHPIQQLLGAGGAPFPDAPLHRAQLPLVVLLRGQPDQAPEDLSRISGASLQPLLDQRLMLDEQGAGPGGVAPLPPGLGVRLAVLPQHLEVAQEPAEGPLFLAQQLRVDSSAAGLRLQALNSGRKAGQGGLAAADGLQQRHRVAAVLEILQGPLLARQ